MASPYSPGLQAAQTIGDEVVDGSTIVMATLAVAATSVAATVTLAFTPDFLLFSQTNDASGTFTLTTSSTTTGLCTFTRSTSTTATVIHYIAADLA